jgi:hypothetical protein
VSLIDEGATTDYAVAISINDINQNELRNGVNSVA